MMATVVEIAPSPPAPAITTAKSSRQKAPLLNLSDMPELLPGAQISANLALKEEFRQHCRHLHRKIEREEQENATHSQATSSASVVDLEVMFPCLDVALIQSILGDAPTSQHAIETLLALTAVSAEPIIGSERPRATSPQPRNIGVEDYQTFPLLIDGDGWQIADGTTFERNPELDLGNAWRDRAKAAASKSHEKVVRSAPTNVAPARRKTKKDNSELDDDVNAQLETDYEFRHSVGQSRAKNRIHYGRGRGGVGRGGTGYNCSDTYKLVVGDVEDDDVVV